jgi:hypothetical protein
VAFHFAYYYCVGAGELDYACIIVGIGTDQEQSGPSLGDFFVHLLKRAEVNRFVRVVVQMDEKTVH